MSEKPVKILSLQGLRALAFIGIFTEHAGITRLGSWGVSCFLILSGFLRYYNYGTIMVTFQGCDSLKDNIASAIRKIKKLYPLHCITLFVAMCVYWENQRLDSIKHILLWIGKVVFNLMLLQSWVPKAEFYFSFNAVSWYLSTIIVSYIAFPYIRKAIHHVKSKYGILLRMIAVIAIQSAISILLIVYNEQVNSVPVTISDDVTKYVTYICPLYRMGDFYIGCLLGCFFKKYSFFRKENRTIFSVMEIIAFTFMYILQTIYRGKVSFLGNDAFRYTLLYTIQVMILVILVGINQGVISKYILSSRIMVFIGDLSGYAFLIHQLVLVIMWRVMEVNIGMQIANALFSFAITILLAYIWRLGEINIKSRLRGRENKYE